MTENTTNLALAAIRIADALLSVRRYELLALKKDEMDLVTWAECHSGYLLAMAELASAEAHLLRVVQLSRGQTCEP